MFSSAGPHLKQASPPGKDVSEGWSKFLPLSKPKEATTEGVFLDTVSIAANDKR